MSGRWFIGSALGLMLSSPALAWDESRPFAVDVMLGGEAKVDVAGYNQPIVRGLALSYQPVSWGGAYLAWHEFADFKTGALSAATLAINGNELGLFGNIMVGEHLAIQPTVGCLWYELDAFALDRQFPREKASTTTYGLTVRLFVGERGALLASVRRALSVSQTRIDWATLGISVRF